MIDDAALKRTPGLPYAGAFMRYGSGSYAVALQELQSRNARRLLATACVIEDA